MRKPDFNDAFCQGLIRRTARRLCTSGGFPLTDIDDAIQELTIHLWEQTADFDESKWAWQVFASVVVRSKAATLRQHHRRKKRGGGKRPQSLNAPIAGGDGGKTELVAMIPAAVVDVTVPIDVQTAMGRMTPRQADICGRLCRGQRRGGVADDLDVTQNRLAKELDEIGRAFTRIGLRPLGSPDRRQDGGLSVAG